MMTQAQEDAKAQIKQLLVEHFKGAVCVVLYQNEEEDAEAANVFYTGGWCQAVGLLDIGKRELTTPDVPEEEEC